MGDIIWRGHFLHGGWVAKDLVAIKPLSSASTQKTQTKAQLNDVFSRKRGVSQHVSKNCGQVLPNEKDIPESSKD